MKNIKTPNWLRTSLRNSSRVCKPLAIKMASFHTRTFVKRFSALMTTGVIVLSILPAFLILGLFSGHAKAASVSQGPRTATATGNCINTSGVGTVAWTSPGNAYQTDSIYSTVSVDGTTSNYIQCTNFGFSIPTGVNIGGIVVSLTRKASGTSNGGTQDAAIRVVKGGVVGSTDKSTATIYTTADVSESHGTNSDLWGNTWLPSDINASNFGAAIAVKKANAAGAALTVSVDVVTITVTYTFNPTFNQSTYQWFNNQDASAGYGFVKALGGANDDTSRSIAQTTDGGYITTGNTYSYADSTNGDMLLTKYDSSGNPVWSRTWGGTGSEMGKSVVQASDGGYVVTGNTDYGAGLGDIFLAKYDSSGNPVWVSTWGSTNPDAGMSLIQTSDGGYAVAGSVGTPTNGVGHALLLKYNSSGTLSWSRTWAGTSDDAAYSLAQTSDGGYIVTGYTTSFGNGTNDVIVLKYDSAGTLSWNKTYGGTGADYGYSIIQTTDGGYAITGSTGSYGTGRANIFVEKIDSTGNLIWSTTWNSGTIGLQYGYSIIQTTDGGYAVTGYSDNDSSSVYSMVLLKYDSTGTLSWNKEFGNTGHTQGNSLIQTSAGGYVVSGWTDGYGVGADDVVLAKFDSSGTIYNCSSPMCQTPTATLTSPTIGITTPTVTVTTPTGTITSPSSTANIVSPTSTVVVAGGPSIDVGSKLNGVAQNTATQGLAEQSIFRLRMALHVGTDSAIAGYFAFKLQYAQRGSDNVCDTSFTGETYTDVTSSTPIAYGDNPIASDGQSLTTNANDPTHSSDTMVQQEYNESNNTNVVSTISAGQDGLWDFALKDNGAPASTAYCFRLVTDTGATLAGYTVVPQITTIPPSFSQENYRWFKGQDAAANNNFVQTLGGTNIDQGVAVVHTKDGGYAVVSNTNSYGAGNTDMLLSKYDSTGALSWSKTWGGTGDDYATSLIQTTDGGYAVSGYTNSSGAGSNDAVVLKYNSTGTLSWSKTWGGGSPDYGMSIMQTSNAGYVLSGYEGSYGSSGGAMDMFLAKFDSSGNLSWSKTWGGVNYEEGFDVVETPGEGIAVTGYTNGYGAGAADMFLAKFDSSGNLSWSKTWGGTGNDYGYSVITTSDGGYAVTGYTTSYGSGAEDMFLAKFDSSGNLSWSKTWGGTGSDIGYSLVQTSDGSYAVTGSTNSYGSGNTDMFLAKFDSSGNLSWSKTWGGPISESGNSVALTKDAGFIVTGRTYSYVDSTNGEIVLAKFDSSGNIAACSSAMCNSPAVTTTTPSPTVSNQTVTNSFAVVSAGSPSLTISSPTPNVNVLAGHVTFAKAWGGTGADTGNSTAVTSDGGYVITGQTKSYGDTTNGDMYIARFDSMGGLLWSSTWGGTGIDTGKSVITTSDGGFMVAGDTNSFGAGSTDMFLVKYTSSGVVSWNTTFGVVATDKVNSVIQTKDGGYAITGETSGPTQDMLVAKFTSTGTNTWYNLIDDLDNGGEVGYGITELANGNLVAVGRFETGLTSNSTLYVAIFTSSGSFIGENDWGGYDAPSSVAPTSDGGFIVSGQDVNDDMYIAKFGNNYASPTLSWAKIWGNPASADSSANAFQVADGGYILAGTTTSAGAGSTDIALVKFDGSGNLKWNRTWGGTGSDSAGQVVQAPDGGYMVVGTSASIGAGSTDTVLLKYSSTGIIGGCSSPTCQSPTVTNGPLTLAPAGGSRYPGSVTPTTASVSATTNSPAATTSYTASKAIWSAVSAAVGTPLAAQDTAAQLANRGDSLRLRFILRNVKSAGTGTASLKLQVAPKVGTCDAGFAGETYVDVGTPGTFNYYDNPNLANGDWARTSMYDPVPSVGSLFYDNYQEATNMTNSWQYIGQQNGLWDVSVVPSEDAIYSSYCFRVVNSDNSLLFGYTRVFELTIPPATKQQMRHGQVFKESATGTADSRQPFYW